MPSNAISLEVEASECLFSETGNARPSNLGFNGYVGDTWKVIDHGAYIEYVKRVGRNVSRETSTGAVCEEKRGKVEGLSWDSRKRLLALCFSLEWAGAVMITLTARESPHYSDVRALFKRLTRRNGDLSAIWVMELQKRGTVHYHLAVFGGNSYVMPQNDLQGHWEAVLGVDLAIVDIRRCDRGGGLYIAKYVSKGAVGGGPSLDNMPISGRRWGVLNKKNLPVRADFDEKGRLIGVVGADERWKTPGVAGMVLTFK